jgi:eukaryotic-like serine/threonine-protein kinase
MRLAVGSRLGSYEIVAPIGAGGMGEVYRARDTKLDRDVAVKVLPPALAGDPAALGRFEREAKAIAALSHPNILSIFDFGTQTAGAGPAVSYAVMELLEGETLRQRLLALGDHGLPPRKAIDIATQIAQGLAAAHEKGVVHRDLKPENIFMATDGRAKILDFGLAKQLGNPGSSSAGSMGTALSAGSFDGSGAAPTQMATDAGTVMGTVGYMSPEQVRGQPADHRSDIFSLGCVLFEMATGRRPFQRETPAETMTAILREDAPETASTANVPPSLDQVIRHCLEKRPEERFQSARDLAFALHTATGTASSTSGAAVAVPAPMAQTRRFPRWGLVPLAVLAGTGAFVAGRLSARAPATPAASAAPVASFQQITDSPGVETSPTLSPDGKTVVYASDASGNVDLYSLRVGGRNPVRLTADSPLNDWQPVFSPDGDRIAFRSERDGGGIFIMEATGESVRRLSDAGYNPSWSPNGREIVVSGGTFTYPTDRGGVTHGLQAIDVATGAKRVVAKDDDALQPSWSPHGTRIAFWGLRGSSGQRDLWTIAADGSEAARGGTTVTDDAPLDWNPTWSPDGRYLYFSSTRGGTMNLWRVPIDEGSGRVLGSPEPVTTPSIYSGGLAFSRDGSRVAFASLDYRSTLFKVGFDIASGSIVGVPTPVLKSRRPIRDHEVSPDGEWVAFMETGGQEDLFVARTDGKEYRRLTDDVARDRGPAWSPDGRRIAFYSDRSGIYQLWSIRPDGSGLEQIADLPGTNFPVWSPDGARIAFSGVTAGGFFIVDSAGKAARPTGPEPSMETEDRFWPFSWSRDGASIAGAAIRPSGTIANLVVYAPASRKFSIVPQHVATSWLAPAWLPDGRHLIIRDDRGIAIVRVDTGDRKLLIPVRGYAIGRSVGVTRDGKWITYTETGTEGDIWMASFNK